MTDIQAILDKLGISPVNPGLSTGADWIETQGDLTSSFSPVDNQLIAQVKNASLPDYEMVINKAQEAFKYWRTVPAPIRGEVVRQIGNALREYKHELGSLVSYEMGKIYQEGLGEVQEMIDICDFAVGQARLINGVSLQSERPDHRLFEQYQPLGIVGIVTSYNFPVAVWAWNSALAIVAGDVVIWKPSSKTPLTAIATQKIIRNVLLENNVPEGVFNLIVAKSSVMGDNFLADNRIPLMSVTGSTAVGKRVGGIVGKRLGKTILELGGNNAVIITPSADIPMAVTSTVFGTVGTAGQRCTTTRRIIIHESIYESVKEKFVAAYKKIEHKIGSPLDANTLIGPLIDKGSVELFLNAVDQVQKEGGKVIFGGQVMEGAGFESGNYVMPCIAEAENHFHIVQEETFAPIVYLIKYKGDIHEAIRLNNAVPQGLSSACFTLDVREAETFLSAVGSDCGIANVNLGTSGAEIGGAFGGEKETGGGRESGSDAWKVYMRRQTSTVNYGTALPLAQGIKFDL
ncbi:MAG TPA: aldehyde dehydrogenase family protein [Saprospirales bacterium]|nr:aldehyde dehydrogenase family protein [Saprospirales bacterium]HAY71743.1 aldehyde dehydrogenase family protein [Saprospirales bacterium]HRQ30384.1 aldehyde dehydrogenase family protein [Saprospiraceae bacterium]